VGFARAQGTGGIGGFASASGVGHGFAPAQGAEGSAGAAAFSPGDIANYELDLDFSDVTKLWQDSGRTTPVAVDTDPIGACDDKSGNARHFTQATGGNRPLYRTAQFGAVAAADFNGSSQHMNGPAFAVSQPTTWFVVLDCDVAGFGCNQNIVDGVTTRQIISTNSTPQFLVNAGASVIAFTPTTSAAIFAVTFNGASSKLWLDGGVGTTGDCGANAISQPNLGASFVPSSFYDGRVGRVILYGAALSTTNLDLVGNYLATIFGTTWTAAS
jgi:hypothetical protein